MSDFLDQFDRMDDATATEVARRIEAGEAAAAAGQALGLGPVAVIAALARAGLGPEGSEGPLLVQVAPSRPRLAEAMADEATIADLFPAAGRPARLALAAGLLQVLDAWEASHVAAQAADDLGESATSAAWHMIAHRREPDPANARYWARRVDPAVYKALIALGDRIVPPAAAALLAETAGVTCDPATLIDLCRRARPGSPDEAIARRIQRVEMLALLDSSIARLAG